MVCDELAVMHNSAINRTYAKSRAGRLFLRYVSPRKFAGLIEDVALMVN